MLHNRVRYKLLTCRNSNFAKVVFQLYLGAGAATEAGVLGRARAGAACAGEAPGLAEGAAAGGPGEEAEHAVQTHPRHVVQVTRLQPSVYTRPAWNRENYRLILII